MNQRGLRDYTCKVSVDPKIDLDTTVIIRKIIERKYKYNGRIVIKNYKPLLRPSNGGMGGDAGTGAIPGEVQLNLKSAVYLESAKHTGENGVAGLGGAPGETAPICALRTYNCDAHGSVTSKNNKKVFRVINDESNPNFICEFNHAGYSEETYSAALKDSDGRETSQQILNQKFKFDLEILI